MIEVNVLHLPEIEAQDLCSPARIMVLCRLIYPSLSLKVVLSCHNSKPFSLVRPMDATRLIFQTHAANVTY